MTAIEDSIIQNGVWCWFRSALCFLLLCAANLAAQSHVPEPVVNLGDTSFLDGIAGPGWMLEEIGDGSRSGRVADAAGNTSAAAPAIKSVSGLTHIAWLSNRGILGAWYGVEVVAAAAHVDAGAQGSAGGWGDLTVSPLILQWKEQRVHGVRIDQRVVFDFDLPVGEYRRTEAVSLSSHAFTVHPYYAITVFPTKRIETSWRVHYLWNSRNDDPPLASGVRSTQAGQAIHFNATIGYNVYKRLWVGANGYYLKQVTAPAVNGIPLFDSPEQVGAIGPGAVLNLGRVLLYANAYHEVGAENRPEGDKLVLRVQWIFGK
jgi:hypothetical protein